MRLLARLFRRSAPDRRARVMDLAARGLDAREIARRTGIAHDVVALVLATSARQKRPAAA